MTIIATAIIPIFLLLLLGYIARRTQFMPDSFWQSAEKATYYILFPLLLIQELANAKLAIANTSIILGFAFAIPLIASLLCLSCLPFLKIDAASFTSFFQAGIRFNTYIGLAISSSVLAKASLALAALLIAIMIPVVNIICVTIFALFIQGKVSIRSIIINILQNPLIIGSLIGLAINLLGMSIPTIVGNVMQKLAAMALPLGLLAVGAGLNLNAWQGASKLVFLASLIKLILLPAIIFAISSSLSINQNLSSVFILFAALPTASSAYILARQLGGNAELIAIMLSFETLVSLITLPACLILIS